MAVEYTTGAPVVGAEIRVVLEPPVGTYDRRLEVVDTTSDVGRADMYFWFGSFVEGETLVEVTVLPQPPFDLPVLIRRDSIRLFRDHSRRGGGGCRYYKWFTVLYPPHLP